MFGFPKTIVRAILIVVASTPGHSQTKPVEDVRPFLVESESVRFRVEPVAKGLAQPSAIVFLPDGRALVAERAAGRVVILDTKTGNLTPVAGLPPVLYGDGDAGVHDVALHPDYPATEWVYVSYSEGSKDRNTTVVDRAKLRGAAFVERQRLFTADAYAEDLLHFGGRLAFLDGFLFVTIGDRHHQDRAQERDTHAGAIVRLHDDGRVPADNPFDGANNVKREIWSYGHRNPQGLAVNPQTHELWEHEHGPRAGDEMNRIQKGANYGWPKISYGFEYDGGPIGQGIVELAGMEQPVWVWSMGIAPSGLLFYTGDAFPKWRGNVFVGGMSRRLLDRLVFHDGRVVLEERLLSRQVGRIRAVAQGPGGIIYLGSDDGTILRLSPTQ